MVNIPDFALVVLIGGAERRAAFAEAHFSPEEIVRPGDASARLGARLARRRLAVADAPNAERETRQALVALAHRHHAPPVAVVLDGAVAADALPRDGFTHTYALHGPAQIAAARVLRVPLACDRRADPGPFDIIGDVHGCREELETLLARLGWARDARGVYAHGGARKLVFLGDLCDRGPDSPGVLGIVLDVFEAGRAYWVPGNHDDKLYRYLQGRQVTAGRGLDIALAQLGAMPEAEREALFERFRSAFRQLPAHLVFAGGDLVVVHGAIKESMILRESPAVRGYALYGAATGEADADGYPVRRDWAAEYRGPALVAYGHTVAPEVRFVNNTVNLDQGAVFGGSLSALRYPEREVVSVPSARVYYERTPG